MFNSLETVSNSSWHSQDILPGVDKTRSRRDPVIAHGVRRRSHNPIAGAGKVALLHDDRGGSLSRDPIKLPFIRSHRLQRLPTNPLAAILLRLPPQHPRQRLEAIRSVPAAVPTIPPSLDPHHVPVLDGRRPEEPEARQPGLLDVGRREEDHGAAPEHDVQPPVAGDHGARPQEVALLDRDARGQDHGSDGHGRAAHEVDEGVDEERRVVA